MVETKYIYGIVYNCLTKNVIGIGNSVFGCFLNETKIVLPQTTSVREMIASKRKASRIL